jgi:FkbM family methyltransferase
MIMRIMRAARSLPIWLKKPLRGLRARLVDIYASKSNSQEGEDMILQRIFARKEFGFYVDIGAHHPRRFSNTCLFYRKGWSGINIEPNPDAGAAFQKERPRDINLQVGISDHEGRLTYYFFNDPALNSFDRELTDSRVENTSYRVIGTKEVAVRRLDAVLREHLPPGVNIDFLSIDVEGLDMAVLRSNDWDAFRPKVVLVEALEVSLEDVLASEVFQFMKNRGYQLFAKTVNTLIFTQRSSEEHRL